MAKYRIKEINNPHWGTTYNVQKKYFGLFWLNIVYKQPRYIAEAKFVTYEAAEKFLKEHLKGYSCKIVKEITTKIVTTQ